VLESHPIKFENFKRACSVPTRRPFWFVKRLENLYQNNISKKLLEGQGPENRSLMPEPGENRERNNLCGPPLNSCGIGIRKEHDRKISLRGIVEKRLFLQFEDSYSNPKEG
jgi:hypothetical protein